MTSIHFFRYLTYVVIPWSISSLFVAFILCTLFYTFYLKQAVPKTVVIILSALFAIFAAIFGFGKFMLSCLAIPLPPRNRIDLELGDLAGIHEKLEQLLTECRYIRVETAEPAATVNCESPSRPPELHDEAIPWPPNEGHVVWPPHRTAPPKASPRRKLALPRYVVQSGDETPTSQISPYLLYLPDVPGLVPGIMRSRSKGARHARHRKHLSQHDQDRQQPQSAPSAQSRRQQQPPPTIPRRPHPQARKEPKPYHVHTIDHLNPLPLHPMDTYRQDEHHVTHPGSKDGSNPRTTAIPRLRPSPVTLKPPLHRREGYGHVPSTTFA